ncbi:galactose-1-epimerase [Bacillus sp. UMB0899]|uniref:aldose epimerase family protein n=1 Tax=Metabacillus schmidteae TaxID=2730405 RepID=UPI000C80C8A6|nr:aldose epimerase family protein [Metabacillus schmidteae]PMC39178.1 galactose-1-epimerase [Bacillus sp. UMB0899]
MKLIKEIFGELKGETVYSFTLENRNGMKVSCITLGCIITDIIVPDKNGQFENVVLGLDTVESYINDSPYFGAVCGRVAGRISNGRFELDDHIYELPKNDDNNHLHGGPEAFDQKLWNAKEINDTDLVGVEFSYVSEDGENGYPGNLSVKITYTLNEQNELKISYHGTTDKNTLVNLTNHSYFNLSGNLKEDILSHKLAVKSNEILELNENVVPTGNLMNVANTPFDFRTAKSIEEAVSSTHEQIKRVGQGIDHPFLLNDHQNEEIMLVDEKSGRKLVIETDQQSVVIYTSNMLEESINIRGVKARKYLGICLETQGLPDSINHPQFSPCILNAGEEYNTSTTYKFTV